MAGRTETKHWNDTRNGEKVTYQYKAITPEMIKRIEGTVKALLHSSRYSLRTKDVDTSNISFSVNNVYLGEAFGIMRGLEIMGYGRFSSSNLDGLHDSSTIHKAKQPEHNLSWWFSELEAEVLEEENFKGDGHCDYCKSRGYSDTKTFLERKSENLKNEIIQLCIK